MKILLFIALAGICLTAAAEDKDYNTVKIRNGENDGDRPKVDDRKANIFIVDEDISDNRNAAPKDSLATKLTVKDKKIQWQPQWNYDGLGGVMLPDATLSGDKSQLAILENTGSKTGPNGSRVVLFNTYNSRIARIVEIPERKITAIHFIPDSAQLICIQAEQKCFKQPARVITLDLESGEIVEESVSFKNAITSSCIDRKGEQLFVKSEAGDNIYIFNPKELTSGTQLLKSSFPGGIVAIADDNNTLVAAGKGQLEFFSVSGGRQEPERKVTLPKDFIPGKMVLCGKDASSLALLQPFGHAIWVGAEQNKVIDPFAGDALAWNDSESDLILSLQKKGTLTLFKIPEFSKPDSVLYPKNMRPVTNGDIAAIFPLARKNNEMLLLDSHGNLMQVELRKKRWQKNLILSAKK